MHHRGSSRWPMLTSVTLLLLAAGCSDRTPVSVDQPVDETPTPTTPTGKPTYRLETPDGIVTVTEILIRDLPSSIGIGETLYVRASLRDAARKEYPAPRAAVEWVSSSDAKARIDASGRIVAVAGGGLYLSASLGPLKAGISTSVGQPAAAVAVTGDSVVSISDRGLGVTVAADVRDGAGNALAGRRIVWRSSDTSVVMVDSLSGHVTPVGAGTARLLATTAGITGERVIRVTPATALPPSTTTYDPSSAVALRLHRLLPGSGTIRVSSGIPLPPGRLRESDLSRVRILVGGQERPLYVEALRGKHLDGSLRSVLVQFDEVLTAGEGRTAVLALDQARTAATLAKAPISATMPEAVALPSSVDYLIATGLVGPTRSAARSASLSAVYAKYESDFVRFSTSHLSDGDNYYDRALNHYAYWIRTGDPLYWERATDLAYKYRDRHLGPTGTSPHASQLEGVALHYWLTGDERSRLGLLNQAALLGPYARADIIGPVGRYREGRIAARALMANVLAWQLELQDTPAVSGKTLDFLTLARTAVDLSLAAFYPDGRYMGTVCGRELNYMNGLLNNALIFYYRNVTPDPRIPETIKRNLDYFWRTQWMPAEGAFQYWDGLEPGDTCDTKVAREAAPDLNMLIVTPYGWYASVSGDHSYYEKGDWIFSSAVAKTWLSGSKQFNQQYYNSYEYLGYR